MGSARSDWGFRLGLMPKILGTAMAGLLAAVALISGLTLRYIDRDIESKARAQLDLAINLEMALLDGRLATLKDNAKAAASMQRLQEAVVEGDSGRIRQLLQAFQSGIADLHMLTVVGPDGRALGRATSDSVGQPMPIGGLVELALQGRAAGYPAVLPEAEWAPEGDAIRDRVVLPVKATGGAEPVMASEVRNALALVGVAPLKDQAGNLLGAVVAAEVLNQNHRIVDEVRDRTGGQVSATIALDGVRVTTNVRLKDEQGRETESRALGTLYSQSVMERLNLGQEFTGRAMVVGEWQKVIYVPLFDHTGRVVAGPFVGIPEAEFLALRADFLRTLLSAAGAALLIAFLLSWMLSRRIVRQLRSIRLQLEELAAGGGDLSIELRSGSKDEIGDLTRAFNGFVTNLRSLLQGVMASSQSVSASAQQLSEGTSMVARTSEQVAGVITQVANGATHQASVVNEAFGVVDQVRSATGQIAGGAQQQAASADRAAKVVAEMVTAVEDAAERARLVSAAAAEAARAAQASTEAVSQNVASITRIRESAEDSAGRVQRLGQLSHRIGSITSSITEIAGQTNLLALNAAIEAARAGEHGKGFAVVADEVRKLAQRAATSAAEIDQLILRIQADTGSVVAGMERSTADVAEGFRLAGLLSDSLTGIIRTVNRMADEVAVIATGAERLAGSGRLVMEAVTTTASITQQNTNAAEALAVGAGEMGRSMASIAAVAEENAAAAEEVSASVEQVNQSTAEIAEAARTLSQVAAELQMQIYRFKL